MCDQDHYEDDLKQYSARGAVSRRQFGALSIGAGAAHGWCPPDSQVYHEKQAERAWSRLLGLF